MREVLSTRRECHLDESGHSWQLSDGLVQVGAGGATVRNDEHGNQQLRLQTATTTDTIPDEVSAAALVQLISGG